MRGIEAGISRDLLDSSPLLALPIPVLPPAWGFQSSGSPGALRLTVFISPRSGYQQHPNPGAQILTRASFQPPDSCLPYNHKCMNNTCKYY